MFTGRTIDELIESVQRAEQHDHELGHGGSPPIVISMVLAEALDPGDLVALGVVLHQVHEGADEHQRDGRDHAGDLLPEDD